LSLLWPSLSILWLSLPQIIYKN